ncbi:MAG: glycosyltransferase family 4 protein [Nitrososphaerota archaeon]|nr:glycosyltransferase family 4 protein [Nitrososphaerota archaeon]
MRVLLVTREYPPFEVGGVAKHTFSLATHLRKIGVDCNVLSFGDPKFSDENTTFVRPSSSIISRTNAKTGMDSKIPSDIMRFGKIANSMIKSEGYDVVHVEEPYVGAFVEHKNKVTTVHDTSYGEMKSILHHPAGFPDIKRALFYLFFGGYLEMKCMRSSKSVIAPAPHVKDELVKVYGRDKNSISVISNGVELPDSVDKKKARHELGVENDQVLVLSASQHIARKRLDTLIEALKLLNDEGAGGIKVIMSGDGPLRSINQSLVSRYELSNIVDMPGWVTEEQLHRYFQAADIYVLTSEYEAGPISLLEAMARGAAATSSRIDGFPRYIRHGVDGLLFTTGDYKDLKGCLERLIDDRKLRANLGEAGRKFASRFSWSKIAEETRNLYEGLA